MRFCARCLLLCLSAGAPFNAIGADAGFSDNSFGYRYGSDFREPGVTTATGASADIAQRIFNFTHVDASTYGGNLLVVDGYLSNAVDPNKGGSNGAREIYLVYRHTFTLSAWTGTTYGFGPVRDTGLVAGFDLNTKDTFYAPRKRMLVLGPEFEFALSRGYFKVALLAEKEYDHNGIVARAENFATTWALESAWMLPFQVGSVPMRLEGYLGIYGPKGRDDFGDASKTETLFHPRLMVDVGAIAGRANIFWGGLGYEFWHDKFGADHAVTPGAIQHATMMELAAHF